MKIKVSEATHNQLSYLVSSIEIHGLVWGYTIGIHHASNQIVIPSLPEPDCYSPFSDWKMCGPIIDSEGISVNAPSNGTTIFKAKDGTPLWRANNAANVSGRGPTPLIAAIRCYVASKLGDEVEVPDELT